MDGRQVYFRSLGFCSFEKLIDDIPMWQVMGSAEVFCNDAVYGYLLGQPEFKTPYPLAYT